MEFKFQEVTKLKNRSECGRIVVNPPKVRGSINHGQVKSEENRFFMCCNRAFLTEERYKQHLIEVMEHGTPVDFSKLPRAPLQPEKKAIFGPSRREFWIQRKKGIVDKVFQVDDDNSELFDVQDAERLERVTVMDVDSSMTGHRGGRYKRCAICNLSTDNISRHMRTCHANGPYKCQYCPCTFISDKSRSLHQRRMHRIQGLPIVSRKKNIIARAKQQLASTKMARDMVDMELQWKNNRVSECPICKKTFSAMHTAREHLNSHYGSKPYKCDQCTMAFNYSSGLRRHKRTIHSFTPRYFCSNCKAGFPSAKSLRFHFKSVHMNKSDFKLKESISIKQSTDAHSEANDGIDENLLPTLELQCPTQNAGGMYDCNVCGKQLTTTQTWRGHMRIHQNVKPFKCKLCGTSFRLHATRSSHIKNCHTNGPYKCPYGQCTCSFNFPRARQRHFRSCRYSPRAKTGISNQNMKRNVLSSDTTASDVAAGFKCNMCGLIFKLETDFSNHKLLHSNANPSTCSLCLKKFNSVRNAVMHKQRAHGSGIHKCTFCCCRYSATRVLFKHLTLEHGMQREEWDFEKKCIFPKGSRRIQQTYSDMTGGHLSTTDELSTGTIDNQNSSNEIAECTTPDLSIGKRMIECNLCHLKVTFNSLQNHKMKSHFHTGKYKCPDCPCKFMVTNGLFVHRAKYHGLIGKRKARQAMAESNLKQGNAFLSPIISPVCTAKLDRKQSNGLSYMCSFCEDTFEDKDSFRKHVEIHQAGTAKQYECDMCHLKFGHRSSVFHHKQKSHWHSGTFQCSKCTCKFMSTAGLSKHTRVHHKSNKFLARSQIMGTGSVLKKTAIMKQRHMNSANSFQCSICAKLLSSQYALDLHLEIHTREGLKKYQCDLCHLNFLHPGSIIHHKRRCHNHNGKYKCSKCSCKFLAMGGLINHETKFHGWIGKQKRRQLEQSAGADLNGVDKSAAYLPDEHSNKVDSRQTVECDICFLQIHAATKMQQHQQNCHFHDGTFQCSFCTCKLKTPNGLSRHKMKYHGVMSQKLKKKNIAAINSTSSVINRLLNSVTKTRISTFTKAQKVLKKTKEQRGASGTVCGSCGCKFSRKGVLLKHMRVAHSNGVYKCKYCNCCFHHAVGLSLHIKWHETGNSTGKRKSNENTSEKVFNDGDVEDTESPEERITKSGKNHATGRFNLNFLKIRGSSNLGKKRTPSNIANTSEPLQKEQSSTGSVPVSPPKLPRSPVKYRFKCDKCGIRFFQTHYLDNHLKKAHVVGGMSCDDCPCTFGNSLSLAAHKRVYHRMHRQTPLPQTHVEQSYEHKESLNSSTISYGQHKRSGVADEDSIDSNVTLESNAVETNNDKITPVKSLIRPTKINDTNSLPKSMFQCSLCSKSFDTKRVLTRHMLCHTRPESCPKCNLRFRMKEEVLKHIRTHHGNGKYPCSGCSCRFSSAVGRNIHFGSVHKKESACSPIKNSFTNPDFVIEHELQEEYDDNEPFIQVNSTYSQAVDNVEYGEESEPIIQGIFDGNYSSNFTNAEIGYGQDEDREELEEGPNSSSCSVSQDNMTVEGTLSDGQSIIQHVACKENTSVLNYQTSSSSSSSLVQKDLIPKKGKTFSPKLRPIKCGTCGITCYGPESLRLHMESHNKQKADQIGSTVNLVKASTSNNGNERRDLKCESCGHEFHNTDELAEHSKIEHDETGHYRCAYCPAQMKTETDLRFHFMKYHDICL